MTSVGVFFDSRLYMQKNSTVTAPMNYMNEMMQTYTGDEKSLEWLVACFNILKPCLTSAPTYKCIKKAERYLAVRTASEGGR